MAQVLELAQYRSAKLVTVLEELAEMARRDEFDGVTFVIHRGDEHLAGVAGSYEHNPAMAMRAVIRLEGYLIARSRHLKARK